MVQLRTVNKAIKARWPGTDLELVKGDDYFYFIGAGTERCKTASVYVPRLNDLTLDRWLEEAEDKMAEVDKRIEDALEYGVPYRLAKKPEA